MTYPGTYRPSLVNKSDRSSISGSKPQWEILYLAGEMVIRCWIPGVKREDIELTIRNHRMHLSVHSTLPQVGGVSFSSIRYTQEIPLPPDADTSWYAAEYHRGVLTIQFPVAQLPSLNGSAKIVVY